MITCSEQEECEEEDQQCNARDNSWKSRTECSGNILERMNLIDEEKPIIDLFLNPAVKLKSRRVLSPDEQALIDASVTALLVVRLVVQVK